MPVRSVKVGLEIPSISLQFVSFVIVADYMYMHESPNSYKLLNLSDKL